MEQDSSYHRLVRPSILTLELGKAIPYKGRTIGVASALTWPQAVPAPFLRSGYTQEFHTF